MKKIILFAIGILTSVTMLAQVYTYTDDNGLTYEYNTDTHEATLTDGTSISNLKVDFIKPSFIPEGSSQSYTVTTIGEEAFKDNININHVVIPKNIVSIAKNAFSGCSAIRLIEFPASISDVNSSAFSNCSNIEFVYCQSASANTSLPKSLPSNSLMYLFVKSDKLSDYTNSDYSVEWKNKFGDRIYGVNPNEGMQIVTCTDDNSKAKGMTFVCAGREGGEAILYKGVDGADIELPPTFNANNHTYNVVGIAKSAFYNSSSIVKLWLPTSLRNIASGAFSGCNKLAYICLKQTDAPSYSPSVFPSNNSELMTLFVPEYSGDNYLGTQWNTSQFADRVYKGKMIDGNDRYGNKYICAERVSGKGDAILIKGTTDAVSTIYASFSDISTYKSYNVKCIAKEAFKDNAKISELSIEAGITTIGNSAFQNCSKLWMLELPNSLKTIGSNAFSNCGDLKHISCAVTSPGSLLPDNLPGNDANNMVTLYVPNKYKTQYDNADKWLNKFGDRIYGISGSRPDVFPIDGMTYICADGSKKATLYLGKSKDDIVIPAKIMEEYDVTGIDKRAFERSTLQTLQLEEGISAIGPSAFLNCGSLINIELPKSLKAIKSSAFGGCGNLVNVVCRVEEPFTIFENVFSTARNLYVPEKTRDSYKKFDGWKKFAFIMEGEIKPVVFDGSTYNCATVSKEAVLSKGDKSKWDITIPATIKKDGDTFKVIAIEKDAFSGSNNLVVLTIENSEEVTDNLFIGDKAFLNCNNLEYIVSKRVSEIHSTVFTTSKATLYLPQNVQNNSSSDYRANGWSVFNNITECNEMAVEIKDNIPYVCLDKDNVKTATVIKGPSTVVPDNGILDFNALSPVVVDNKSYPIVAIAKSAFSNNGNIKELRFSDEITTIEDHVFYNCTSLNRIEFSSKKVLTSISESAFENNSSLKDLPIPEGVQTIGMNAFKKCSKLETIEFPSTLKEIANYSFDQCDNISKITSRILIDNLENLCDIGNVFTSDISPVIYVPVGTKDDYYSYWKSKFHKDNFIAGELGTGPGSDGWNYKYIDGGSDEYRTATLINALAEKPDAEKTDVEKVDAGHLVVTGTVTINGNKFKVTEIAESAFKNYPNKNIDKLTIDENIGKVNAYAFQGLSKLQKIWLPQSLTSIGSKAFEQCNAITHVNSKAKAPSANDDVFNSIPSVNKSTLFIPSKEGYASECWNKFSNIIVGEYVADKSEGDLTYLCYKTDVVESESTTVRYSAIVTKSASTVKEAHVKDSVTLGELIEGSNDNIYYKVTQVGKYAFQNCTQLTKLELPSCLESIGYKAFADCGNIKTIISFIPASNLGGLCSAADVFASGVSPEDIYIPGSKDVYSSTWDMFAPDIFIVGVPGYNKESDGGSGWYYDYLTVDAENSTATLLRAEKSITDENGGLTIPANVTIEGKPYKVTKIAKDAFSKYPNKSTDVTKLIIQDNIEVIRGNAFSGFSKLEKIELPASLDSIQSNAFGGCSKITHVCSKMAAPFVISDDVFSLPTNNTATLFVPSKSDYTSPVWNYFSNIVEGEYVADKSEGNLTYLCYKTDVVEGESTTVRYSAIVTKSASTVKEAHVKDSVTLGELIEGSNDNIYYKVREIGAYAFQNSSSLNKVWLPKTLTSIGENAFAGCTDIKEIVSDIDSVFKISSNVFSGDIKGTAKVYIPAGSEGSYSDKNISGGWSEFKLFESGKWLETENPVDAYMKYRYHTSQKIATLIGVNPTGTLETLPIPREVTINDSIYTVTEIGPSVFKTNTDKNNIKTIDIQADIVSIGANAFQGSSNLTKVILSPVDTLAFIDKYAFQGCGNLSEMSLPSSLTTIGDYAFSGTKLSALRSASIKTIGVGAFSGSKVTEVRLDSVETIGENAFQNCGSLQTVWLPSTLSSASIGAKAFDGCNNIRNVNSKIASPSDIGSDVFSVSGTTNTATLFVPADVYESYNIGAWRNKFANIVKGEFIGEDTQNKLAYSLYKIVQSEGDSVLAAIVTKSSVTGSEVKIDSTINVLASGDSESKTYEVREIGAYAFQNSSSLNKVWLPKTLTFIGDYAFDGCTDIKEIVSDIDSVFKISSNVFSGDIKETAKVYIPAGSEGSYSDKAISGGWSEFKLFESGKWLETENPVDMYMKYRYHTSQKIATLIGVNPTGSLETLPIPKEVTINDSIYTVTEIGPSVFKTNTDKDNIKTIDIQADIVSIGANAFQGSSNLTKVILSSVDTLAFIDKYAFQGCGNLSEMSLPSSLTTIGDYAFSGTKLSALRSASIKTIGVGAFSGSKVTEVRLDSVVTIGESAFQGCSGLKIVEFPSSLTSIGEKAFSGCNSITHINSNIDSPDAINPNVFSSYTATLFVSHKDNYKKGGWENFLKVIEGYLVDIPTLEGMTFDCVQQGDSVSVATLTKSSTTSSVVNVPSTVKAGDVTFKVTTIDANAFNGNSSVEELTIPGSVKTIGASAFQGCSNLQKLWLPVSLTSIGSKAFNGCNNLTRVCIEAFPTMENTDAFSTYSKTLLFVPTGTLSTIDDKPGWRDFSRRYEGYYVDESPEDVDRAYIYMKQTEDKRTAILYKSKITDPIKSSVTLDGNTYDVTIIGESAFSGVTLDNLELPSTITEIERRAFQNQKNLTSITLPSNLKIIGNDAFSGNSKLESLTFSDKVEFIGDNAFKGCSSLKKLLLPTNLKTIGDGAFSGNSNLNDLTISEGTESIGDNTFKDCNSLQNIVLPSTLKSIGATAFDGCNNLTEVISKINNKDVIENNSPSMPNAVLYVQEGTKSSYEGKWDCLHILEGDRQISDVIDGFKYAYSTVDKKALLINATKTGDVTIPGSIKIGNIDYNVIAIDKAVFKGNTDIKSVVIEDHIKTIGANVFQGCSNLKMIELPASIKSIGEKAFDGCNSLIEVVCKSDDNDFVANNVLSLPNATLYVHEGTKSWYEGKWSYARIYEGERKIDEIGGLLYAYSPGADEAILVGIAETAEWTDGKVTIPGAISVGEPAKDYNVIDIADNVFKDNTAIKTIEIGENIQSIADNAFDGCANLKEVVSKIKNTSAISGIAFSLPNAILYVPDADLVEIYKSSWTFADYYVGNRLTTEIDGMSYVYATGDKIAILVNGIAEKLGEEILIKGSIIPEGETEEYTVIAVKENAFKGNTNIKTLKIEEKVKTIGANAFQGCSNLNKVWLPATLESIGEKAFDGCDIDYICTSSKTPLVSPNINNNVFSKYKATLYVPNGTLGSYSDSDVWKTFPIRREGYFKGVKTENGQTYECLINGEGETSENVAILAKSETTDKEVEVLSSVKLDGDDTTYKMTTISTVAFSGNNSRSLEKIIFPETLRKIEDKAFVQCTKLSVITSRIEKEGLTEFNENVFPQTIYDNATVYIPNDAETEAKYKATDGWKYFKIWAKGEKKTKPVGSMTYDYLVGVGTATLTGTSTSDEVVTIDGNITIDGVTYQVTAIGESAFNKNPNRGKMVKLIISENIKTIDANAFQGCNNLKKVWLPSTLTSIGAKAFDGCNAITHVSSKVDNPALISENVFPTSATLFVPKKSDYSSAKFSYVAEGELVDDLSDNGMTYDCLKGNKAILKKYTGSSNDVDIPSSVKIGNDSYTVAIIAKPAFTGKTNIERLVIPAGVGEIDAETFNACSKLKWIESKIENPISISSNVFANYTATLFIPKNNVTEYENKGWKFLNIYVGERKETTISDGCTYVYSTGDKKAILIKTATNDKEVTVNGTFKIGKDEYTVTAIAESVFKGKTKMETLKISENIKNIGAYAFQGCTNLQKIEFPATLKKIGSNAFDGCTSLVSVTCEGKEPAEIGTGAFPSYNITVNVPKEAVDTYKGDTYWREFTTILGITTTVTDDPTGPYNITAEAGSGATPTVELWNGMDASGEYVIPEKVEIDGSDYMVTAIAAGAFEDNTNLTNITIPSSVSSIGTSAFAGCSNLKSITVKWENPLQLSVAGARGMTRSGGSSIFDGVNKNTCILYVPAGCVDKYKAAAVWKEFKNILEIGTTAINGVVIAEDGKPFDIYNMQGRKVRDNVTSFDGLPSGVYIVNGKKVMVK